MFDWCQKKSEEFLTKPEAVVRRFLTAVPWVKNPEEFKSMRPLSFRVELPIFVPFHVLTSAVAASDTPSLAARALKLPLVPPTEPKKGWVYKAGGALRQCGNRTAYVIAARKKVTIRLSAPLPEQDKFVCRWHQLPHPSPERRCLPLS